MFWDVQEPEQLSERMTKRTEKEIHDTSWVFNFFASSVKLSREYPRDCPSDLYCLTWTRRTRFSDIADTRILFGVGDFPLHLGAICCRRLGLA